MHLDRDAIRALGKRHRAALINSVSGFKSAALIGTADTDGQTNLALMTSLVHVGANPPLLGLVLRPDTAPRHTLENIRDTGCYTINHVHESFVAAAHQTSARYPRDRSEFLAAGLTEAWLPGLRAPFVAESRVRLGMRLREEHSLAINGTHLLIGEILILECPDDALTDGGGLDPAAAGSVAAAGLDSYYLAGHGERYAYAKADRPSACLGRTRYGTGREEV
jgi:flavin reductase (DIM6/NTAB) family NADH-FMN oxidoreductase RutF